MPHGYHINLLVILDDLELLTSEMEAEKLGMEKMSYMYSLVPENYLRQY